MLRSILVRDEISRYASLEDGSSLALGYAIRTYVGIISSMERYLFAEKVIRVQ